MQITTKDLEAEVNELEKSENRAAQIAVVYLKRELNRRKKSGRRAMSNLSRKEQVREAVRRHRAKLASGQPTPKFI